MMLENIEN